MSRRCRLLHDERRRRPPYAFKNFKLRGRNFEVRRPTMVWRSVGNRKTEFARESGSRARERGRQRLRDLRRDVIAGQPAHAARHRVAAEIAEWGNAPTESRRVDQVLQLPQPQQPNVTEISLDDRERVHIDRIGCARCGIKDQPRYGPRLGEGGPLFGSARPRGRGRARRRGEIVHRTSTATDRAHAGPLMPSRRSDPT